MSRILSQRLASGVGAGDLRWIEEWGTAFWKIVGKASTVEGTPRPTRLSMKGMRGSGAITDSADRRFWAKLSCFGIGITNVLFLVPVCLHIAHLFVADSLWILLVLASAELVLEPATLSPVCARVSVAKEGPAR
jgi:hypothetical protein